MKKIFANIHPFLFTLNSLLFLYKKAIWETSPIEMFRPLIALSALLLALYPLASKIARDSHWAGILLTIFVLGFVSEEKYFILVGLIVVSIVLILSSYFTLNKRQLKVSYFSGALTLIAFILFMIQSVELFVSLRPLPRSYYQAMLSRAQEPPIPLSEPASGIKPDIYYIVLDAYSSTYALREFYSYDNSAFVDDLENLGFFVPTAVLSNYPRTALSVSTTLDMQYWSSISPSMEEVSYWWPTKPVLDHSRVRASLESVGYQSVSIASDWSLTNNMTTDHYSKPYPFILNEYENLIIASTPLEILHRPFQGIAPLRTNEVHRRFILYALETLAKIPDIPGPKFVFVHLILPHPPFVFKADGSSIESKTGFTFGSPTSLSREEYRQSYIEQIEFTNSQLRAVIKTILDKSTTPPIILLQADHGLGLSVRFDSSENLCLKDRFSAFGAYYLPGKRSEVIPGDLTPVNLFRIIFNEYFDADLALLENHQYFTNGHGAFAGLREVTEQVNEICAVPSMMK